MTFDGWIRVDKRTARRLYNEGHTIRLVPVKCSPVNNTVWHTVNIKDRGCAGIDPELFDWELKFDSRVNQFEYYNCQYNELGKYSAYYVREA